MMDDQSSVGVARSTSFGVFLAECKFELFEYQGDCQAYRSLVTDQISR